MKKIINTVLVLSFSLIYSFASSQVAIGKNEISKLGDGSQNPGISLEFGSGESRGIIVPWVSTQPGFPTASYTGVGTPANGTIIFDLYDEKLKYKVPTTIHPSGWFDLTGKNKTDVIDGIPNTPPNTTIQDAKTDNPNAKVIIGSNPAAETAEGILVLSDKNKAMVLPTVNKYSDVKSPSAGMMVYDLSNNMLCVFNGTVWSFWKP